MTEPVTTVAVAVGEPPAIGPMRPVHPGHAGPQIAAEPEILRQIEKVLQGITLTPGRVRLSGGAYVDVDGVAADSSAFVEVFAHQGPLKGGQRHKVTNDALKLITLGRDHPNARLIVAFADPQAASCVTGKSWIAVALRSARIEVIVADIGQRTRDAIRAAQEREFR